MDRLGDLTSQAVNFVRDNVNRAIPPKYRQQAWEAVTAFAHERPYTFAFVLLNLLFSLGPILLFLSFFLAVLGTATAVVILWTTLALVMVLVPVLIVCFTAASLLWLGGRVTFMAARSGYELLYRSQDGGGWDTNRVEDAAKAKKAKGDAKNKSIDGGLRWTPTVPNENVNRHYLISQDHEDQADTKRRECEPRDDPPTGRPNVTWKDMETPEKDQLQLGKGDDGGAAADIDIYSPK